MLLDEITVGDTMADIDVTIVDAEGTVRDIDGFVLRLFLEGAASGDRPFTPGDMLTIAALSTTDASDQLTRASGSFVADGVEVGMLVLGTGIPEGAVVAAVSALAVTLSINATATASGLTVRFWFGILGAVIAGPNGDAKFSAVGALLDIGGLLSDTYVGKVRMLDGSNSEIGWTNSARGVVEFKAVQP